MRILVIPDVHGRKFWKNAVRHIDEVDHVVFLGDYLDPYEFEKFEDFDVINNFTDIIAFGVENKDKVTLLLGNHDLPYYFKHRGNCRYMAMYRREIEGLFQDEREIWRVAYETEKTLFTHAGFLPQWAEFCQNVLNIHIQPTAENLNKLLIEGNYSDRIPLFQGGHNIKNCLEMVSMFRGGNFAFGSCVWADVGEHLRYYGKYQKKQVFGHTLQVKIFEDEHHKLQVEKGKPVITDDFAMVDTCQAYIYDEDKWEFITVE